MKTQQEKFWSGEFGKEYTDRNTPTNLEEWNKFYLAKYGKTRKEMLDPFLNNLSRDIKILEVGCNTGLQLAGLQAMGFKNIYGVELQWYAVEQAKSITKNINIVQGSGFDLPFKDGYFDLVMTNGVLIHIAPDDLPPFMKEMHRCSKQYLMGFEYHTEGDIKAIPYRGNEGFLWKANYAQVFQNNFSDLSLVNEIITPYISENEQGNKDTTYLLEKK